MIRSTLCILLAASALLGLMPTAQAQIYVPHTTTHFDAVPHHGHIDIIPHTTTHYDALPFPSHGAHYGGYGSGYRSGYGANYDGVYRRPYNEGLHSLHYGPRTPNRHRHGNTHLDIVPHRGHLHVEPHTTWRRHHH